MKVTIEYAAQVKRAAGVSSEEIEIETSCTVDDLMAHVATRHGDSLRKLLFDSEGSLQHSILVFVGDTQARWDDRVELKDGDTVTLLSPIAGG